MEKFSNTRSETWKIRRGVNLEPLLPPFMWQRSRLPPDMHAKSSTNFSVLEEKIVLDETRLAAVQKFAPASNILLGSRRTEGSFAKSTVDFEADGDKKISQKLSDTTKDSRDFRSTVTKEFSRNDTDPMVSHALSMPYERLPPSRYYRGHGTNSEYNPVQLAKRSRSPIRHVLSTKFDLEAARKKLPTTSEKLSITDHPESSADRVFDEIKSRPYNIPYEHGSEGLPFVLKVILEEVVLVNARKSFGLEVQAIINVATTWALVELEAVELAKVFERKLSKSQTVPNAQKLCGQAARSSKSRSFSARIPRARNPLQSFQGSTVHQSLPWDLLCPGHESGIVDVYRNVADCIDEKMPGAREDNEEEAHIPDLTCHHFLQVDTVGRDKKQPRVSPHRNFRRFRNSKSDTERIEEFLVQLVSFL